MNFPRGVPNSSWTTEEIDEYNTLYNRTESRLPATTGGMYGAGTGGYGTYTYPKYEPKPDFYHILRVMKKGQVILHRKITGTLAEVNKKVDAILARKEHDDFKLMEVMKKY